MLLRCAWKLLSYQKNVLYQSRQLNWLDDNMISGPHLGNRSLHVQVYGNISAKIKVTVVGTLFLELIGWFLHKIKS